MMSETEITIKITNKKGLHARAAAKFVKTAEQFDAHIMVAKVAGAGAVQGVETQEVFGGSILGLMMLGAECNSVLRLRASGLQAKEAASSIKKLVEEKFGETD
jgi:phosphocarrier protein